MVSKLIVAGTLFFGAVFADVTLETKDFEEAICTKSYKAHTETKDLKLDELTENHGCGEKFKHLCWIQTVKDKEGHLMCSAKSQDDFKEVTKFTLGDKFSLREKEFKEEVHKIDCKPAKHTYESKIEKAVRAMKDMKTKLEDLGEVKVDTQTICIAITEEEETKKDGDKKTDGEKKETKKITKVHWFVANEKEYKPTEKVEKITILGKEYKGFFCGKKDDVVKEAKAFEKAEEASGCCSCAWYVWVIVAVVIVGAGVGAYFVLKEDDKEDEYEAEYGA